MHRILAVGRLLYYCHSSPTPASIQRLNCIPLHKSAPSVYVPELMGLVRPERGSKDEDKGQESRKRRLDEDQTEQMCGKGGERACDENRLGLA